MNEQTSVKTLVYDNEVISQGDVILCKQGRHHIHTPQQTNSSGYPQKGISLMNVMIWPTLMFVGGFVGLFFSIIFLVKEGSIGQMT